MGDEEEDWRLWAVDKEVEIAVINYNQEPHTEFKPKTKPIIPAPIPHWGHNKT